MKTEQERFAILQDALSFLGEINIQAVRPVICTPYGDDLTVYGFKRVEWAPYVWIGETQIPKDDKLFTENRIFSIGLASVLTCLQLELKRGDKVLDMCAAPGIKSLYLQLIHDKKLELYVNDVSHARLIRLRALFDAFKVPIPIFSNQTGQSLAGKYKTNYFDAVLIDAPCSGEGNILKGDTGALKTWSPAKVKRLADLQRKLLKTGKLLLKDSGQFVYATCTLNMHENEGAIKKAHGTLDKVATQRIGIIKLSKKTAVRILPSDQSIGFFIARLEK